MGSERATWLKPYHFPNAHGNRRGRGKSLTTLIKEALQSDELCGTKTADGRSVAEWLAESMIGHAIKGNAPYMNQVMDRIEGKISVESDAPEKLDARPVIYIPDNGRDPNASGNLSSERPTEGDTVLRGADNSAAQHEANPASPNGHCQNGQNGKGGHDLGTSLSGPEAHD